MTQLAEHAVRWDLSALYFGTDDPKIEQVWTQLNKVATEFEVKYRGQINNPALKPQTLLDSLESIEKMTSEASKPLNFAHLLFAANSGDPALGAFMAKQMEYASALSVKVMFYELELQAAPDSILDPILKSKLLDNYRHYVDQIRVYRRYRLSESEETVLEEVANTGSRAWMRLFEEVTSNPVMHFADPTTGTISDLTTQETLAKLRDPDRKVRIAAGNALSAGLKEIERVLVFTYNNLLQDKSVEDRLRKFEYPEQARHLSNELSPDVIELVIRLCQEHYSLVSRFYNVKKQILKLPELTHIDRYAPLFVAEGQVGFDEARRIVLGAFEEFSSECKERAGEFFEKSWIDAEPRSGKGGGAFCSYNTPDTHPVVFMTYLNKIDDVMTLAHELGHGIHASFSRDQTYFNFSGTLPLAELSSTFGEMLTFEKVTANATLKDRVAMYAEKIESIFATVFRQAAMYRFEQRCHKLRRESGEITPTQFGDMWQEEIQAMFGESLILGEEHRMWWSYVSHFIASPFYVYAYSIGELLAISLYNQMKKGGSEMAPKFVELLRMGGSKSPGELMEFVGVDLSSEAFWEGGFKLMTDLVTEFERLWQEYSKTASSS